MSNTYAQKPHEWEYLTGDWTFESSKGSTADVTWTLAADGNAVVGEWKGSDGTKSAELVGWRGDKKALVVNGYGSSNNYWHAEYTHVSANRCKGPAVVAYPDGTIIKGTMVIERVDDNTVTGRLDGKNGDGADAKVTWSWTRKSR